MKKSKTIIIALVAILGIGGGVKLLTSKNQEENFPPREEEKESLDIPKMDEEETKKKEEKEKDPTTDIKENSKDKPKIPTKTPNKTETQNKPTKPAEIVKPVTPEEPSKPEEVIEDFVITNDMITNGVYELANKKYGTLTIAEDIRENAKILLDTIEIKNQLIIENPKKYQLDITNTTIPSLLVKENSNQVRFLKLKRAVFKTMNKALNGATVNIDNTSQIEFISIANNVEINGLNRIPTIEVSDNEEVVLNIPGQNVIVKGNGLVTINQHIENLINQQNAEIVVNAKIENLENQQASTIHINGKNTISNFNNKGENTIVAGTGSIENATISANNTRIYVQVTNKNIDEFTENVLIREEEEIKLVSVRSKSQGNVMFTLNKEVELSLNDLAIICNAGKNITLYNLRTTDKKTYTLSTSYFKNNSYALYITLPNGNIISSDFETDYANPTIEDIKVERVSANHANLKLYGVDEGAKFYYLLTEENKKDALTFETIKEKGNVADVKVGFNTIQINNLEKDVSYKLYYVVKGYFENIGKVNGPIEIPAQKTIENESKYEIVYAKEEIANRFVFKLNRIPEKELTLSDFTIDCPGNTSLTIKEAKFSVSPDLLTYIIEVPSNYGHKDNEYVVKIKVSERETIEKEFITHLNPPTITGAVDNVKRITPTKAELKFNSDEAGTVYYGVYEWNGGIYEYDSTTPFASSVLAGEISSKKQKLYAGENTLTIDLSNITVTKNTQIWALYVDTVGNYRVGFVEHYKIPEYKEEIPKPESTIEITDLVATNKSITIELSGEIGYNVTQNDVKISIVKDGSLPAKLMLSIITNPKKVDITIGNYTLPAGEYKIEITATDTNDNIVVLAKNFEITE